MSGTFFDGDIRQFSNWLCSHSSNGAFLVVRVIVRPYPNSIPDYNFLVTGQEVLVNFHPYNENI